MTNSPHPQPPRLRFFLRWLWLSSFFRGHALTGFRGYVLIGFRRFALSGWLCCWDVAAMVGNKLPATISLRPHMCASVLKALLSCRHRPAMRHDRHVAKDAHVVVVSHVLFGAGFDALHILGLVLNRAFGSCPPIFIGYHLHVGVFFALYFTCRSFLLQFV